MPHERPAFAILVVLNRITSEPIVNRDHDQRTEKVLDFFSPDDLWDGCAGGWSQPWERGVAGMDRFVERLAAGFRTEQRTAARVACGSGGESRGGLPADHHQGACAWASRD